MEFHELAAVVFVESTLATNGRQAFPCGALFGRGMLDAVKSVGIGAHGIVQIIEHGRAVRRGRKKIAELAEHVRADGSALVGAEQIDFLAVFVNEHVEMIEPEIGELLGKLAIAVNGSDELRLHELIEDHLGTQIERGPDALWRVEFFLHALVVFLDGDTEFLRGDLRALVFADQRGRRHGERAKSGEARLGGGVIDGFGVKLTA